MRPNRKTNPGVKAGQVQKKNWQGTTHNYFDNAMPEIAIDRRRPGPGAKHFVTAEDVRRFIRLIPDWEEMSNGLRAVVLTPFNPRWYGQYWTEGVIQISAWPSALWMEIGPKIYERDKGLYDLIGVEREEVEGAILLKPTAGQVMASQFLGTFLHELGHHVDRISSRKPVACHNGEPYAEAFEREWRERLWPAYVKEFKVL